MLSIKLTVDLYGKWLPMESNAAVDRPDDLAEDGSDETRLGPLTRRGLKETRGHQGQLAPGGLRSAEPRLAEARWALATPAQAAGHRRGRRNTRRRGGQSPYPIEDGGRVRLLLHRAGHHRRRLHLQRIHSRVGMRPPKRERLLLERAQMRLQRVALQEQGARWHEEPKAVLHRIDRVDQGLGFQIVEPRAVIVEGGPRREGHPRQP